MSRRGLALLVISVLLVVVPVLLLGWLRIRTEDRLAELQLSAVPVILEAAEVLVDGAQQVVVRFDWGPTPVVLAPAWSGVVTRILLTPGSAVDTGDVVVEVDGVGRVAAATGVPFWRTLSVGDTGDDVAGLQALLGELGYYGEVADGVFDRGLAGAVGRFAADLGFGTPEGVFDPAWIVWLPYDSFRVENVNVSLGAPAPGPGSVLLEGSATAGQVTVTGQDGRRIVLDGEWTVEFGASVLTMVDGEFTEDSLVELIQLARVSGEGELFGRARLTTPARVLEIPSTAVTAGASGILCVWVPAGDGYAARTVALGGGRVARAHVISGLNAGDRILANPGEILESPVCP